MNPRSTHVIELTPERFEADVLEGSRSVPVVVDFWANWCGPCRMLGPTLEKLADEYGGRFTLVKADTDRCGEIAQEFGVRSIPAVFGLRDGAVVDSFVGALPESAIRSWLDRLMPSPAERLIAEAKRLEADNPAGAESKLQSALALEPDNRAARLGLARIYLATDRLDESRTVLATLEAGGVLEREAERLKAELSLRTRGGQVGGVEKARASLASNPEDRSAQLRLAEALAASGAYAEALELCLDLVERDRAGVGEAARAMMLSVFQVLPPESELVAEFRRKLSAALY